ncbi:hypothetical protein LJK88_23605 [Paenibacillus sp. P26]|nr:hypothetical protein LJK88_23605 [Paenibacillus sp. P26]
MNPIVIVGRGKLTDAVCMGLREFPIVRRQDISEDWPYAKIVLVLQDQGGSFVDVQTEELLRHRGIPWLGAYVSDGEGW